MNFSSKKELIISKNSCKKPDYLSKITAVHLRTVLDCRHKKHEFLLAKKQLFIYFEWDAAFWMRGNWQAFLNLIEA